MKILKPLYENLSLSQIRMNNVSAFTASTNVDGSGDVIHWRTVGTPSSTMNYVPWEKEKKKPTSIIFIAS